MSTDETHMTVEEWKQARGRMLPQPGDSVSARSQTACDAAVPTSDTRGPVRGDRSTLEASALDAVGEPRGQAERASVPAPEGPGVPLARLARETGTPQ